MATQAGGLIQDQNLNVQFDGVKTNASKAQKNGGAGGRKALNDISNSGWPSMLQLSKKHNSKNVISVGEEIGGPSKIISSVGGKRNVSKAPEKLQSGGRKALADLTNSGKPHVHQASKKRQDDKLNAIAEEQILPDNVAEEQFLHNHQECIKAQRNAIDIDKFLKITGLDYDNSMQLASPQVSPQSRKLKAESPPRYLEKEERYGLLHGDQYGRKKAEQPCEHSPCGSPKSPRPCVQWKDYNCPNFMLIESP